jgi:hypothetical protein
VSTEYRAHQLTEQRARRAWTDDHDDGKKVRGDRGRCWNLETFIQEFFFLSSDGSNCRHATGNGVLRHRNLPFLGNFLFDEHGCERDFLRRCCGRTNRGGLSRFDDGPVFFEPLLSEATKIVLKKTETKNFVCLLRQGHFLYGSVYLQHHYNVRKYTLLVIKKTS